MKIYLTGPNSSKLSPFFLLFLPPFLSLFTLFSHSQCSCLFFVSVLGALVSTSDCLGSLPSFPGFLVTKPSRPHPAFSYTQSFSPAWSSSHYFFSPSLLDPQPKSSLCPAFPSSTSAALTWVVYITKHSAQDDVWHIFLLIKKD